MSQLPQHTSVHVHQNPTNGLGTASCICSIVGWFTCGLLCPIGLILGLCSLGKEPKGMSIAGVIIGALGTIVPVIVFLIFGTAIFAMCGGCFGLASLGTIVTELAKNQMAAEPAADAIIDYYELNGQLPDDVTASTIIAPFKHEGHGFRYQSGVGDSAFYLEYPGPDGQWDTSDDWQTTWDAELDIAVDSNEIDQQGSGTNSGTAPDDADPNTEEVQDDGE